MANNGINKFDLLASALRELPLNFDNIESLLVGKSLEELQSGAVALYAEVAYLKWVMLRNDAFAPFADSFRDLFNETIDHLNNANIANAFYSMQKIGLQMGFVLGHSISSFPTDKLINFIESEGNKRKGLTKHNSRRNDAYGILEKLTVEFVRKKWEEDTEKRIRKGQMINLVYNDFEKIKNKYHSQNFTNEPGDNKDFWDYFKQLPVPSVNTLEKWIDQSGTKPGHASKPGAPRSK